MINMQLKKNRITEDDKMVDMPNIDLETIGGIRQALRSGDIGYWFSDNLAVKYAGALPTRFEKAKNLVEKEEVYRETGAVLAFYAVCTYYLYQNNRDFRKKIDSNAEYRKNFKRISAWLERNDGRKMAEEFFENAIHMEIVPEKSR